MSQPAAELETNARPDRQFRCQWVQAWRHVLFAHWPVGFAAIQQQLPCGCDPDLHEGQAWVSAVAFHLTTRPPGLPDIPFCSNLWELNLRTYVRRGDEHGVMFLSMHGSRWLPVWLGQHLTPLPYVFGRMRVDGLPPRRFRCHDPAGWPLFDARIEVATSESDHANSALGTWLLERYFAFGSDGARGTWRMRAQHAPWMLQPVRATVAATGLGRRMGLDLHDSPALVHYSPGVLARTGRFEWLDQIVTRRACPKNKLRGS